MDSRLVLHSTWDTSGDSNSTSKKHRPSFVDRCCCSTSVEICRCSEQNSPSHCPIYRKPILPTGLDSGRHSAPLLQSVGRDFSSIARGPWVAVRSANCISFPANYRRPCLVLYSTRIYLLLFVYNIIYKNNKN